MKLFGNFLTHYGYEYSRCSTHLSDSKYVIDIRTPAHDADLRVEADLAADAPGPPCGSPFPDLREARKFAGPLPFTFDYERQTNSIIRVEGVRTQWNPRPVSVVVHLNNFFDQERFRSCKPILANAFLLEDVPYRWRAGIREVLP